MNSIQFNYQFDMFSIIFYLISEHIGVVMVSVLALTPKTKDYNIQSDKS